jgi:hypothetical protein
MDWLRCGFFLFMAHTELTNTYRNEQYVVRTDWLYNWERKMIGLNFNSPDKSQVALNILRCTREEQKVVIDNIQES